MTDFPGVVPPQERTRLRRVAVRDEVFSFVWWVLVGAAAGAIAGFLAHACRTVRRVWRPIKEDRYVTVAPTRRLLVPPPTVFAECGVIPLQITRANASM